MAIFAEFLHMFKDPRSGLPPGLAGQHSAVLADIDGGPAKDDGNAQMSQA